MVKTFIYGIKDIRDDSIIYVGKTNKNLKNRFTQHFCDKKYIHKYEYLQENKEYFEINYGDITT